MKPGDMVKIRSVTSTSKDFLKNIDYDIYYEVMYTFEARGFGPAVKLRHPNGRTFSMLERGVMGPCPMEIQDRGENNEPTN